MDVAEKLEILADAAKYDVACTSSGASRSARKGSLGSVSQAGICHSFSADGRCITLLKVLLTNVCVCDCAYCVNRVSNEEVPRTAFRPRELADLTIGFYRRNYIEGLFLSSGVIRNADFTTELMIQTLEILRYEHRFRGYIHAKAVPGTSPELLDRLGHLADRLSVNLELPSAQSLKRLAPDKSRTSILSPMRQIMASMAEDADTRALMGKRTTYLTPVAPKRKTRAFAPAGQSTQMIIGASPESDHHILNLAASLYRSVGMRRVFFSAYLPVNDDARLPATDAVQLNREHRLYQADWLLRFYGFDVDEVIEARDPFLDPLVDPKANWALNHLEQFPVEVNTAPYEMLLRVPGIGVRGAKLIVRARRHATLREEALRKLGIAYKRARLFITCDGHYAGQGVDFTREALRAQLAAPPEGGRHGRRADKAIPGQLSLFESVDTPEKAAIRGEGPKAAHGMGAGHNLGLELGDEEMAGARRRESRGGMLSSADVEGAGASSPCHPSSSAGARASAGGRRLSERGRRRGSASPDARPSSAGATFETTPSRPTPEMLFA